MAKKEPKVTLVNENEVEHTEGTDLVLPDITLDFEKIDTIQKNLIREFLFIKIKNK